MTTRQYAQFLLRDPDALNFPFAEKGMKLGWLVRENRGSDFRGIGFAFKCYDAYMNDSGEWDMANAFNRAIPTYDNPWLEFEERIMSDEDQAELILFNSKVDAAFRATITVDAYIPFETIVAIDELGDECFGVGRDRPALYVAIRSGVIEVHDKVDVKMMRSSFTVDFDEARRIRVFPEKFRRGGLN